MLIITSLINPSQCEVSQQGVLNIKPPYANTVQVSTMTARVASHPSGINWVGTHTGRCGIKIKLNSNSTGQVCFCFTRVFSSCVEILVTLSSLDPGLIKTCVRNLVAHGPFTFLASEQDANQEVHFLFGFLRMSLQSSHTAVQPVQPGGAHLMNNSNA